MSRTKTPRSEIPPMVKSGHAEYQRCRREGRPVPDVVRQLNAEYQRWMRRVAHGDRTRAGIRARGRALRRLAERYPAQAVLYTK